MPDDLTFPLPPTIDDESVCAVCTAALSPEGSFVKLTVGQTPCDDQPGVQPTMVEAFFEAWFHGPTDEHGGEPHAHTNVFSRELRPRRGVFFCSTACLRAFFHRFVDAHQLDIEAAWRDYDSWPRDES